MHVLSRLLTGAPFFETACLTWLGRGCRSCNFLGVLVGHNKARQNKPKTLSLFVSTSRDAMSKIEPQKQGPSPPQRRGGISNLESRISNLESDSSLARLGCGDGFTPSLPRPLSLPLVPLFHILISLSSPLAHTHSLSPAPLPISSHILQNPGQTQPRAPKLSCNARRQPVSASPALLEAQWLLPSAPPPR